MSASELEAAGSISAGPEEPVLVNVTRMTPEKYWEAAAARGRYLRSRLMLLGGAAAAVIGLLMGNWIVAVLGAAVAVVTAVFPSLLARRDMKRLEAVHPGGMWTKTIKFYPDRLETDAGTGAVRVDSYDAIQKEHETAHMYILEFGKTAPASAFDKDGFEKGSLEEMKAFLTEARRRKYMPGDESGDGPADGIDQQGSAL